MGTRHHQKVINKAGEVKISQYGQFDGYYEGQGFWILQYLLKGNLGKYQEELEKINEITKEESKIVEVDENWMENYPYLSRDCGYLIHQMIEDGKVKFVKFIDDDEANKWCEGFYTIDFSKRTYTCDAHGIYVEFSLDNLPTEQEYLSYLKYE